MKTHTHIFIVTEPPVSLSWCVVMSLCLLCYTCWQQEERRTQGQGQGQVQFQSTLTTTQVHQGDQGKKTYQFEHKCKLILDVSVELQKSGAYDCDSNDPSVISL